MSEQIAGVHGDRPPGPPQINAPASDAEGGVDDDDDDDDDYDDDDYEDDEPEVTPRRGNF